MSQNPRPPEGPLGLLLEKERHALEQARTGVQQCAQRLEQVRAQSQQLNDYRRQYQGHWQHQFRSGTTTQIMACYQQFHQRLDTAIAQQQHTVGHVEGLLRRAQEQALLLEIRVAGLEKLIERRERERQQQAARAEQRSTDEWALRARRAHGADESTQPLTVTVNPC